MANHRAIFSRAGAAGLLLLLLVGALYVPRVTWASVLVRVGVYQNSPKVALSSEGRAEGIFIDVLQAVAKKHDWQITYVPGTWAQGLERLQSGEIDLMPDVAYTHERTQIYRFHQEPVLASWNQVYARQNSSVRALPDLQGQRVAVLRGSVQQGQFSQMAESFSLSTHLQEYDDFDAAFAAVAQGQADAVVTNRFFGVRNAPRYGLQDTAIIFAPSKLFFAAPLQGREALLEALDDALHDLKAQSDSVYYRSLRHWAVEDVRAATPSWMWPVAVTALLALSLSSLAALWLRQRVVQQTQALHQRQAQTEAANRVLRGIGRQRNLKEVLDEALQGLTELGGFAGGVLCLPDEVGPGLRVGARSQRNEKPTNGCEGRVCALGCMAAQDFMVQGQWYSVRSVNEVRQSIGCMHLYDPQARWYCYFLLPFPEGSTGVLCLYSLSEFPPEASLVQGISDLCGAVAMALDNARLYEQIQHHARELEQRVTTRTAALEHARYAAESADRTKSAFLATMSHELRTPLNSIIGFTGIVLQGLAGPLTAEQSKQLGMVRDSARHLLALINDVLDISKIEAGELRVERMPFALEPSLQRVVGMARTLAQRKGLELVLQAPPDLGEMVSDARRFEQVILNLIGNAIKFSERGTVWIHAQAMNQALQEGAQSVPCIQVQVRDEGMGIGAQDLATLFAPFRQIDSALSRQHEGTGLGLAICRRLCTLMGGTISVTSTLGEGSVFTVTLPRQAPPPDDGPAPLSSAASVAV